MKSFTSITTNTEKITIIFILLAGILSACTPGETSANLQEETPTIEVAETLESTIEPTPTEIPPEVDLTWGWEDFEGYFRLLPTEEKMKEDFEDKYESLDQPVYMVFGGNKGKMFLTDETGIPLKEENLDKGDTINWIDEQLGLSLDGKGKEILKQFFLYTINDGRKMRLYIFVDSDGCLYEKNGALIIITKADNDLGLNVGVYRQEDIPWNQIPKEYWDDIAAGYTLVDLSGNEAVCSCNINDIRASSEE